jgi:hypothetical protein
MAKRMKASPRHLPTYVNIAIAYDNNAKLLVDRPNADVTVFCIDKPERFSS